MKHVGFSIVGCGSIGNRHADLIIRLDNLIAVCDTDEKALTAFGEKHPDVRLYTSIDELLIKDNQSQVINICTPNGLHAKHTIKALEMGKHVVCEKPMALSVIDCREMIETAETMKRHLFIVKQNRYNPPVQMLKELIVQGRLGKIYEAQLNCFWNRNDRYYNESSWKGTKDLDGGILFTQFSHFIDLLLWLIGDIKSVRAKSANFKHNNVIEFEDTIVALLEFESDILATLNCTINSYQKNMEGSITIIAENGTVKIGGQYLNTLEYQNIKNYKIENIKEQPPVNDYGYYQGSMSNHDKVIQNVIDVINFNGIIAVGGKEGLKTVKVIEEIYSSLEHSFKYDTYGQIA